MNRAIIIHTSELGWLDKAIRMRLVFGAVDLVDDANTGVEAGDIESLLTLIQKHQEQRIVRLRTVLGVGVGLCLSLMGLWIIHEAVTDPEATGDLWVLLSGGVFMTFFGGLGVLYALGQRWRISASSGDRNMTVGSD
ncbi:hypothetical protein HW090_03615 [Pseudomonas sp. ABC1]|uniref:hypothetical protein n=1 Tax=Pseudomonas sp. ABC1 TaxID=2748080 RepID=UPI0015C3342E|nr:hypothetical protein [Pseudomonas sp. ABC1]QLF92335.1 hypothetical protein HW090_03615 [Pseudomonas sp. ABC1]